MAKPKGSTKTGGRQKGTLNKSTEKRADVATKALASGITPLEVMLKNMRWAMEKVEALSGAIDKSIDGEMLLLISGMRKVAQDAAKDAAPYLHPRLASTDVRVKDERSRDELIARANELHDRYGIGGLCAGAGSATGGNGKAKPH